jgi:cytochrome c
MHKDWRVPHDNGKEVNNSVAHSDLRAVYTASRVVATGCLSAIILGAFGVPSVARTANEAQALAERAVAYIGSVGRERAFADFSRADGGFVDGELYIYCQDMSGVVVAHGGNPKIVGQNMAGAAEDVQALVERAAVHIRAVGAAQGFADITRPDGGFIAGELYVFCTSTDGTSLAHGGNPKLVGKNFSAVRDGEGRLPNVEINRVGQTQGQGWVEYLWPNPQTRRVQRKLTYVLKIDSRTVCAGGYYRPDPS